MTEQTNQPKMSRRGFASMDADKRREIANKRGVSVPREKRRFSPRPLRFIDLNKS